MISVDALKRFLGLGDCDATTREIIRELEKAAVDYLESQTNRYFGDNNEITIQCWGPGARELYLPEKAIDQIANPVTVTEASYPGGTTTALTDTADDGWLVMDEGRNIGWLVRKGAAGVWRADLWYAVTYRRGYEAGSEPEDVKQAVRDLVAWWFNRQVPAGGGAVGGAPVTGLTGERIGDYSYTLGSLGGGASSGVQPAIGTEIPSVMDVINAWRLPAV